MPGHSGDRKLAGDELDISLLAQPSQLSWITKPTDTALGPIGTSGLAFWTDQPLCLRSVSCFVGLIQNHEIGKPAGCSTARSI